MSAFQQQKGDTRFTSIIGHPSRGGILWFNLI